MVKKRRRRRKRSRQGRRDERKNEPYKKDNEKYIDKQGKKRNKRFQIYLSPHAKQLKNQRDMRLEKKSR